jgi:Ca2+-binding EF-hand superfamily protein
VALYGVLKEYDPNLTENESRLLVRYLNFNYESSDRVDYKEFTTAAFKLFDKMELRDRHVLQLFFSTIPLTTAGAVDEIPSDATGPFNKETVAPGDNSAPVPISTALEAALTDFVLRIKQKYNILTKSDAETAFRRIDKNKNKVVSKAEFEAMAKECIPEATDSARNHLYRMFDRTNVGSFNVEQFVDVVVRRVPHHLDRMEILIDKTEQFSQVIKEIDEKLRRLQISLLDLFPGQKQVRKLMIIDKFDQHKVLDPTKRIPAMLDLLEVEQGGIRVINLEELAEIIKVHKPQQKTINQMLDTSVIVETGEQNYDFRGPDKTRIDQVIDLIRKAINEKPEKAVYNLFKTVDKNGDQFIEFPEFFFMLKQIDKRITEREAKVVFKRVDLDRTDTISQDEFVDFFGMRSFVENESLVERARRRDTRFDSILEDLTKGIAAKSTKPESVYVSPTDTFTRQSFDKSLKVFNVSPQKYANFADFIKAIQHRNNPDLIDLTKLKLMLHQYYQDNRNIITQDMTSKAEILLDQLLRTYQDIPLILSTYDSDRNGFISLAEFTIFTKRILGPQSFTDTELETVYKTLKGDEKELMAYMFNLKLIEVQSKYNQHGASMLGFSNLNSSMDMVSPRSSMVYPSTRPGSSIFDFDMIGGGEQSMPGMPPVSTEGMSPEEKRRAAVNNVYVKIRDMIHYKEEELIDELKAIDKDGTNLLHSHYIWQALKKLGATESAFTDAEKKLMFEEVAKSDERYYYLDFFRRVFPTKQLVNITNAKELTDELIKQQQIRKETLSMLVHEAFAGNETVEMTYPQFEKFLSARGLLLSEDTRDRIFGEFDVQYRRKISVDQFKAPFNKDGVEEAVKLKNNLKFYLRSLEKTTVDAFAPFTPKSKDFDFKEFATALEGINFPIKYIEIETLFEKLGGSQDTKVTLDQMASILDQPIPPKVETIDSTLIRRSMYKEIKAKYHGFQHFFETFDSNDKKYLSLADFGQMLTAIGITFSDLKADVRPMYEAINIDKNYRLSQRELNMFYDESTILILFPVITQFRTAFLNYVNTKMEPAYFVIAQHSSDPTAGLGLKEFQDLLKTIGLTADDDQAALIFNELDYSGDKMVTPAELRRCLSNVMIDVVGLSETISTTLYRRGIDTRVAFTSANTNADDGLNFPEFYDLVVNKLKLNLNIVEVEELFDFAQTGDNKKVTVSDFVNLFSSTRKVNPFLHNKKYMENLPEESRKYYLEKYRTLINAKGNLKGFNREADRHLLEMRRRSGHPALEGGFALEKVEGGDQSMAMMIGAVEQPSQEQITEIDQMFGERLKTKKKADEIELTYKAAISDNFSNTMSPEDLQGLLRDLNMFPKKDEVEAMYKRIQSYAKEPLDPINLATFITYAKTVLDFNSKMKENGVNLVGIAGPALKKYLLFERILPEEHYKRYKARSTEGLLGHEFQKMIDDLKLPLEPTYDETMKLFHFLCRQRDDEILTYNDFLNIFDKPEEIIAEIIKTRHEGLLFELKVSLALL